MNRAVIEAFMCMQPREGCEVSTRMLRDTETSARVLYQMARWPCWALPHPDAAVAIGGVAIEGEVGELWMVTGFGFDRAVRSVLRTQRKLIRNLLPIMGIQKLLVRIDPNRKGAVRWVQALGFERTLSMPCLTDPGAVDVYVFNQVKGG